MHRGLQGPEGYRASPGRATQGRLARLVISLVRRVNLGSNLTVPRAGSIPAAGYRAGGALLVVRRGDELGVVLGFALEREEVVVAAAAVAGIAAAGGGAGRIDGAAPFLGVEEPAHPAEVLVLLAAHGILVAPALDRELRLGLVEGEVEVLGKPFHIPLGQRDQRIGAAVARTFRAVVHFRAAVHLRNLQSRSLYWNEGPVADASAPVRHR